MTKTKQITKATVKREIKRLVAEFPDRINPVGEHGGCLYIKGRGRNIRRCIIGQMGYDLGLRTPEANFGTSYEVATYGPWEDRFTEAAVDYMGEVQGAADGDRLDTWQRLVPPIPWGQIPKSVLNS